MGSFSGPVVLRQRMCPQLVNCGRALDFLNFSVNFLDLSVIFLDLLVIFLDFLAIFLDLLARSCDSGSGSTTVGEYLKDLGSQPSGPRKDAKMFSWKQMPLTILMTYY